MRVVTRQRWLPWRYKKWKRGVVEKKLKPNEKARNVRENNAFILISLMIFHRTFKKREYLTLQLKGKRRGFFFYRVDMPCLLRVMQRERRQQHAICGTKEGGETDGAALCCMDVTANGATLLYVWPLHQTTPV